MLTVLSGTLEPTATYCRRSWVWLSTGSGEAVVPRTGEVVPCLGLLWITVQHRPRRWYELPHTTGTLPAYFAKKPAGVEVDQYAVEELEPEQPGTRLFALLNIHDREQGEPYRVTVGGVNRCRCLAGVCRVPSGCKHRSAVIALIEAGALEESRELVPY